MTDIFTQQTSIDIEEIARFNAKSANKVLYIIRVEDPQFPNKTRKFAALKLVEFSQCLQVVGIEIPEIRKTKNKNADNVEINTYSQALDKADKEAVVDIKFPWHRIISIQNVNYQHKSVKR